MDTKLTLKLNKEIIEKAKVYAASQKRSLSRLVENYLKSLVENKQDDDELDISPFVKSLAEGTELPAELDEKEIFRSHQEKKHL